MAAATASTWIFAALLLVAGGNKLARPGGTEAALQGARLPSDRRLVRLLGLGELMLGAAVLTAGGVLAAAVLAVTYATFAAFTAYQSRQGAGCGCFGDASAPATGLHVGLNAGAAALAAVAAWGGAPAPAAATDGAAALLALAVVLATGAALLRLLLTAAPELTAALALHRQADA